MKYSSADEVKIYQSRPKQKTPSTFRAKGWTESVDGYIREAKKLTMCLIRNRQFMDHPYPWAVHLNINVVLTPAEIRSVWSKSCRNFKKHNLDLMWVREANRFNKVHYHMIVKNDISRGELERIIEVSMPSRSVLRWRKKIETIDNEWRYCHYIT